jgi:hypothetical protein
LLIIIPMAADHTSLALTTGRHGVPMGGLRSACAAQAAVSASFGTAFAGLSSALPGALALSLELPIGCRA